MLLLSFRTRLFSCGKRHCISWMALCIFTTRQGKTKEVNEERLADVGCRWHMDIKPTNILCFQGPTGGRFDITFKLGDFATSVFPNLHGSNEATRVTYHGTYAYGESFCNSSQSTVDLEVRGTSSIPSCTKCWSLAERRCLVTGLRLQ